MLRAAGLFGVACALAGGPTAAQTAASGSAIAARLPAPVLPDSAPAALFLQAAAQALAAGRNGEAMEAMERAESRALTRSVRPSQARVPDRGSLVQQIAAARAALSGGDRGRSLLLVQDALRNPDSEDQP